MMCICQGEDYREKRRDIEYRGFRLWEFLWSRIWYLILKFNILHEYILPHNILHPNLYKLIDDIDSAKIYTFNLYNTIKGSNINVGYIDAAMGITPFNLCKNIKWKMYIYEVY
jgi:hypothetical protein